MSRVTDKLHKTLKPIYKTVPGWSEDISGIRQFADLPEAAKTYVAWLLHAPINVANYGDRNRDKFPNLRYIGVGPEPSQIIKDVPAVEKLLSLQLNINSCGRKNYSLGGPGSTTEHNTLAFVTAISTPICTTCPIYTIRADHINYS